MLHKANLFLTIFILFTSSLDVIKGEGVARSVLCAYSHQDIVKYFQPIYREEDEDLYSRELLDDNMTERCPHYSKNCYVFWQEDPNNSSVRTILAQGCWDSSGMMDCTASHCVSRRPSKALNNTNFCCCQGNFCNLNVSEGVLDSEESSQAWPVNNLAFQSPEENVTYQMPPLVFVTVVLVCPLTIFATIVMVIYRSCGFMSRNKKNGSPDSMHLMESGGSLLSSPAAIDFSELDIYEAVGCGRYGAVYRATHHGQTLAVKMFPSQHRQYYLNERSIYSLAFMDHPYLLKYFGGEERVSNEGELEYLLVLSYAPYGCLQDYLRNNKIDWSRLCKMARSVVSGLAHLHTEIIKGGKTKLCIAHRDLTSNNILISSLDGTCKICDFGFATCISGSKYYLFGDEQVAETNSLADVGTLRYMAPEVLEGAVNLRDCESSLKQIDIYALGLILWEMASRCADLYQGMDVPCYKLPFEAEIGLHPSMGQMQVLVSKNKARPLFPDIWKDTNPAVRTLKETIDDCWDQDADARLTALCVEERLSELMTLWERFKTGLSVSPTINTTTSSIIYPPSFIPNYDTENTGETILSPDVVPTTPAKNCLPHYNNNNNNNINLLGARPCVTVPLQPYQGRNPCIERNLMVETSDDSIAVSGNTLVARGGNRFFTDSGSEPNQDLLDAFSESVLESHTTLLVPNEFVAAVNNNPPARNIPYVQNAVYSLDMVPKQPNLPGNGQHNKKHNNNRLFFPDCSSKGKKLEQSLRRGFKSLLGGGGGKKNPPKQNQATTRITTPLKGKTDPDSLSMPGSSNQSPPGMETEVQLTHDRGPVTRLSARLEEAHSQPLSPKTPQQAPLQQRPNNLPLQTERTPIRKTTTRIKTPYELKNGRFSLYDDRIMSVSSSSASSSASSHHPQNNSFSKMKANPKMSLSLPHNINSLLTAHSSCENL